MNTILSWLAVVADGLTSSGSLLGAKLTLLLALAWLLHASLRRSNPRWRVLLWRTSSAGAALLLLTALSPPFVNWPVLPPRASPQISATSELPRQVAAPVEISPVQISNAPEPPRPPYERQFDQERSPVPRSAIVAGSEQPAFAAELAATSGSSLGDSRGAPSGSSAAANTAAKPADNIHALGAAPTAPSIQEAASSQPRWLTAIWCAGGLLATLRLLIGLVRLFRIRQTAIAVPDWVALEAATIAHALRLPRRFEVRQTDQLQSPCIVGIFRPLVLLPERQCCAEHRDELPAILAHELAHMQGLDLIWNAVLNGLSVVLWFHPLMWRMRLAHADACDAVCDSTAVGYLGDAVSYGRTLARLTLRIAEREMTVGLAMARGTTVRQRIEMVRRNVVCATIPRAKAICAVAPVLMAITLLGGLSLTHSHAAPPQTDKSANKPSNKAAKDGAKATGAGNREPAAGKPAAAEKRDAVTPGAKPPAPAVVRPETIKARMAINAVADKDGKPLEGVQLTFHGTIGGVRVNENLETDEDGWAWFERPALARVEHLWMTATIAGYVPQHYTWRNDQRPIELQEQIDLKFEKGAEIGGIVQDEKRQPIAGAGVEISMPITWPRLDNYIFNCAELKTDDKGRWSWGGAPANISVLSIRVVHPDYLPGWSPPTKGRSNVAVLKQGLQVAGRVVDAEGRPIAGAVAQLGFDRFGTNEPQARTDDDGRFVLKNCKAGKSLVTVQADGFSPKFQALTVGEQQNPLAFQLEPGRILRVRIVDTDDQPIAGAHFFTDSWQGFRTLECRLRTDAQGAISWNSAPAEAVLCDMMQTGFMAVRNVPLKASDEFQTVTLHPELVISGEVTDAATGEPIPEFRVRQGQTITNGNQTYWSRDEALPFKDGKYQLKFSEPVEGRLLQVVADGYAPVTSRRFESNEGAQMFDFALKPEDQRLTGVVLLPNGDPAVDAEVGLAIGEKRVSLKMGRFDRRQNGAEMVKTDAEGRFSFPSQGDNAFLLVVVHDAGFADVLSKELAESNRVKLRGWGQMKGKVRVGAKPDANCSVQYSPDRHQFRRIGPFVSQYDYSAQTNPDGEFEFERMVPGPGVLSRFVVTQHLGGGGSMHSFGWQTSVEVVPGETATVTIGGMGRPVTGRIVLNKPDVIVDWTSHEPAAISRWNKTEKQPDKSYARFVGNLLKSGHFTIPDVPAGDYKLSMRITQPPEPNGRVLGAEIGKVDLDFTIPEIPGGRSDEPFNIGDVNVVLADTLDPGEAAPEFVAERLSGGALRFSEFRGKLVLISFWATWSPASVATMPDLQKIHERFSNDRRFALVGLSCDNDAAVARRHIEANAFSGHQAFAGNMNGRIGTQYTVRALPATYLIGPNGRVLAKNLKGEDLERAIAAALADKKLFETADETRAARFPVTRFETKPETRKRPPAPAVVVLDDTDPDFDVKVPHDDRLRVLSASGEEIWSLGGLNACQTTGGVHGVVIDRRRNRIYVRENVANRITALTATGQKLWQVDNVPVDALALDEKTGNVWCSGGRLLNEGETVVFDPEGNEVAAWPYRAIDLVYDPNSDAFWLVGYEWIKLNRNGDVLFRKRVDGWSCASVAVDPDDGSVWIAERNHPDMPNSKNRLWHLNSIGTVRRQLDRGERDVFVVAFQRGKGEAWISGYNSGLQRVPLNGEPDEPLPFIARSISISPTTGDLWIATSEEVLRIDATGRVLIRSPFRKKSLQSWLMAF